MSKNEALVQRLNDNREILRTLLFLFSTTLIGIATVIYNVMAGSLGFHMLVMALIGILALGMISYGIRHIRLKNNQLLKELENA